MSAMHKGASRADELLALKFLRQAAKAVRTASKTLAELELQASAALYVTGNIGEYERIGEQVMRYRRYIADLVNDELVYAATAWIDLIEPDDTPVDAEPKWMTCRSCSGTGAVGHRFDGYGVDEVRCTACDGSGEVVSDEQGCCL